MATQLFLYPFFAARPLVEFEAPLSQQVLFTHYRTAYLDRGSVPHQRIWTPEI
jgi:hypothetical protein